MRLPSSWRFLIVPSVYAKNISTSNIKLKNENVVNATSIYDFTVEDTYGNTAPLSKYKGNVVLIVNVASQCGLTKKNYAQLTEINKKYRDLGLRTLSFPSNSFKQSPESDGDEMMAHLKQAGADIGDVFKKIDVNGENTAPLYVYLKSKLGGFFGDSIKWNYTKFLVNKNGQPVSRYGPTTEPMELEKDIEKLLAEN